MASVVCAPPVAAPIGSLRRETNRRRRSTAPDETAHRLVLISHQPRHRLGTHRFSGQVAPCPSHLLRADLPAKTRISVTLPAGPLKLHPQRQ